MPVLQVFKDKGWLDSCVKIYTHPSTNTCNGNWPILLPRVLTTNHLQRGHCWSTDIFVMIEHCWFVLLTCENVTSSHHRNNPLGQFCGPMVPKLYLKNVSNLINYTNCHSSYIIVKRFFLYLCRTLQQKNVNDYNIRLYRIIFKLYHNFNTLRDSISNKMLRSRWEEQVEGRGGGSPGKAFWGRLNLGPCFKV